ncbi:MAG: HEAT repeat domain-containing protein [Planctomycetota bacterium]|nr:MAG: HEAT repeat domain-containing protein [Planctomycetota bacterium]
MTPASDINNVSELREAIRLDPHNPALYMRLGQLLSRSGLYSCTQGDEVYHPFELCHRYCCARWAYQKARLYAPDDESVNEVLRTYRDPDRHREGQKAARAELESSNDRLGAGAAYYLGLVGDEEDLPKLVSIMDKDVLDFGHLGVIRGLGNLALSDATPAILDVLEVLLGSGLFEGGTHRHFKEAIYAIGGLLDEKDEQPLLELWRKDVRIFSVYDIMKTLRLIGSESSFELIEKNYSGFEREWSQDAVITANVLDKAGTREMMTRIIEQFLYDEYGASYWQGRESIRAFQIISEPEDIKYLTPFLDRHPTLAGEAMISIAATKSPDAKAILEKLLQSGDYETYAAAYRALGVLGDPAALPAMKKLLWRRKGINLADQLYAIAQAGGPEAIEIIVPYLSENEPDARAVAVAALAETGDEEALPYIWNALEDSSMLVCDNAAEALGKFHNPDSGQRIIHAWPRLSEGGRGRAANTLRLLGCSEAVPLLLELFKDERIRVRSSGALAVGALAGEQDAENAKTELRKLFEDEDEHVLFRVRQALFRIEERNV